MNSLDQHPGSRVIEASAPKVWDIIADFGGIHRFHPFIKTSPLDRQRRRGPAKTVQYFRRPPLERRSVYRTEPRGARWVRMRGAEEGAYPRYVTDERRSQTGSPRPRGDGR